MDTKLQAHIAFHLTGNRAGTHLGSIDDPRLLPALLSGYQDLSSLRYDFPLVLLDDPEPGDYAEPLSGLVDGVLERAAEGRDADRIRQHVLRLETGIRAAVADGARGSLSELWDLVAGPLSAADELVADSLRRARLAMRSDGEVLDCDEDLPYRLLSRAWGIAQDQRAVTFNDIVARLIQKLTDILKADFQGSRAGRSAENLKTSFGTGPMDAFDFEAMSRILGGSASSTQLPGSRRQRLMGLLSVLQSQQFFATPASSDDVYTFTFDDCSTALEAYRKRLPRAVELARAIAIGELEVTGEYDEERHELLFESFGSNGLDAEYQAMLPDYLVRLNAGGMLAQEQELLFEMLSADLPFKVIVQSDDVLEESEIGDGHLAFSLRSRSLASTAMGLTGVFVLQSPSSALPHLRTEIQRGLDGSGPALFSIFSGAGAAREGSSAYLVAAAALESRVFPVFVYDPTNGQDWASRFTIAGNPQPEQDWPLNDFAYQDQQCRTVSARIPFSLVDFVAADPRYGRHFARVAQDEWSDALVPVTEVVDLARRGKVERVPSVLMVDGEDRLHRVVVDEMMIREARRCRSMWHSLQELGGIHNSHAERLLAREEAVWQDRLQRQLAESGTEGSSSAVAVASATAPADVAAVVAEEEAERSPDEAYIETARCSTCNECTQINNKMFVYNENQQAYIADISAGTYAQLVEAAESCQVSVIHPGKPRNGNEPGLEDLLKRAELFV
jgi:hypothetical protein